jgi:hypothetical protein
MSDVYLSSLSPTTMSTLKGCLNRTSMPEDNKNAYLRNNASIPNIANPEIEIIKANDQEKVTIKYSHDIKIEVEWSSSWLHVSEDAPFRLGSWSMNPLSTKMRAIEITYSEDCQNARVTNAVEGEMQKVRGLFSSEPNALEMQTIDELKAIESILPENSPAKAELKKAIETAATLSNSGDLGQFFRDIVSIITDGI